MSNCQSSNCSYTAVAVCLHCQQHLCVEHLLQHNDELISQANMYCDEFNKLTEKIENMSFDQQFTSAEEDLNDWLNDQMKQLDKIYEGKLFELKQAHLQVKQKLNQFKQRQKLKIEGVQRRLFNSQLTRQISLEQLNQMKAIVEQLKEDIDNFRMNQCSIKLVNNDQKNYSYLPNIEIRLNDNLSVDNSKSTEIDQALDQVITEQKTFQLRADAKPFDYIPKVQNCDSPLYLQ